MATEPSATIGKAFRVLRLFESRSKVTVSMCQQELGIPRSTAHRLLVSLRDAGAVEQVRRGHYVLSLELFELGVMAPQLRLLDDRIGLGLEALAYRTGYRVHVGVLRDLEVLYVAAANGHLARLEGVKTRVGYRGPLHATSTGKIFLSYGTRSLVERLIAVGMTSFTANTIIDEARLRRSLDRVREDGFAVSVGEFASTSAALAVPIHARDGAVQAALSIVGDNESILRKRRRLIDEARRTAAQIERGAGGTYRIRIRGSRSVVSVG